MLRLMLPASALTLVSCAITPEQSGLYGEGDNVLTDRKRETYIDANNSRRGRTVCEYRDGSTLTVEAAYNCPPVFPEEG